VLYDKRFINNFIVDNRDLEVSKTEVDRFNRDIELDTKDYDLKLTESGDLVEINGIREIVACLLRRITTFPDGALRYYLNRTDNFSVTLSTTNNFGNPAFRKLSQNISQSLIEDIKSLLIEAAGIDNRITIINVVYEPPTYGIDANTLNFSLYYTLNTGDPRVRILSLNNF
jgi:hypothetical protein